jgi:hypothetical protein
MANRRIGVTPANVVGGRVTCRQNPDSNAAKLTRAQKLIQGKILGILIAPPKLSL